MFVDESTASEEEEEPDTDTNDMCTPMSYHMMYGNREGMDAAAQRMPTSVHWASCTEEMIHMLKSGPPGHDIVEFCGGQARLS